MHLLIVDDHRVVREGVAAMLMQGFGGATRVHHAPDLAEALRIVAEEPEIEVVLLDLFLPGDGGPNAGFAGIEALARAAPHLPVVILSSSEEPRDVRRALASGALGYIPKSAGPETLTAALDLVLKGEVYVPPLILEDETAPRSRNPAIVAGLTDRQVEVLAMIVRGHSNKQIARTMRISEKTVKAHVTAIFKSFGVINRTQAAAMARSLGLA
ncbi:response regulator transcription factor [Sphingomonas sp. JC676]|uniref:response regulator transcription factor n=1 Tax=Sphingomonas sp. JC676 TaxID=2768065 RepID=UPI001658606B|nr:response regulator transcription factor [Sphingomonas sp. JC676]MBC9032440.1 response regulator transcription factor [Sphingomonas sp. JC676]